MEYIISTGRKMTSAKGTVALKKRLSEDFCGQDVSVKFTLPSGAKQVRYVSISKDAAIKETYGDNRNFDEINW